MNEYIGLDYLLKEIQLYIQIYKYTLILLELNISLHERPYFQSPGISRKSQKDLVNIIFHLWLKRDRISHLRKVQNKDFSVISKYHLFINFSSPKILKQDLFSNQQI